MGKFGLFLIFSYVLNNPLFGLAALVLVLWLAEGTARGRYFNPVRWFGPRSKVRELSRTLAVNPHDLPAHLERGRLLVQLKRHSEAVGHLEQAVTGMPDSAEGWYLLGRAQLHAGDPSIGHANVEKALEMRGELLYGEPQLVLGDHYMKQESLEQAERWYQAHVDANSSSTEGYYKLGRAQLARGDDEAAVHSFDEAVEAWKSGPRFHRRRYRPWKWRAQLWKRRV